MTLKGGTSQACAACKYQRRKCSSECLLAPYFPPDQQKTFHNAHRLFGVSNIVKILKALGPHQRAEAMHSIIYQANVRDRFPVHGCCEIISRMHYQIQLLEEELQAIHLQIQIYRQHSNNNLHHPHLHQGLISNSLPHHHHHDVVASQFEFGASAPSSDSGIPLLNNDTDLWIQNSYDNSNDNHNNNDDNNGYNSIEIRPDSVPLQPPVDIQQQEQQQEVVQDYDHMHSFFDTIDDRRSYVDSKEAYESSSEEALKDTTQSIEQVAENELKTAASCFSLTSFNSCL